MTFLKAILLGLVQGLTEFLPVSSSGHLVLAQHFLKITEPPVFFDVMLHVGTLGAVIIFFQRDIRDIFLAIFGHEIKHRLSHYGTPRSGRMFAWYIIAGSIPTAILALTFEKYIEKAFTSALLVSVMLIITGTFLWLSGRIRSAKTSSGSITTVRALITGTAQGIAALPGISRSGATISTAIICGISREEAARYSLLLSVPAILGAAIIKLKDAGSIDVSLWMIIAGASTAFVTGYLAIKILIRTLKQGHFSRFAYYCWGIGILGILGYLIL